MTKKLSQPRLHTRLCIIPFPQEKQAWILLDPPNDEDYEVLGPYPVIAAAFTFEETDWKAEWWDSDPKEVRSVRDPSNLGPITSLDECLKEGHPYFLILPPDIGDWLSPWIYGKEIFFEEIAARSALEKRRVSRKNRVEVSSA